MSRIVCLHGIPEIGTTAYLDSKMAHLNTVDGSKEASALKPAVP